MATAAVLNGGIDALTGRIDAELRTQNMSDDFVVYLSGHFEAIIDQGLISMEDGQIFFDAADQLMNHEILAGIDQGIEMMLNGELTEDQLPLLLGMASVAEQRNIASDEMLDYYFGFGGNDDPVYLEYF
ncbi:MAG: hypothetical protein AAF376_10155 [Pseudomonadota bacterium]